jgi:kinesin family protein 3/17
MDMRNNPHLCQYHSFKFDYVYSEDSSQACVYDNTAKAAVLSTLEGYNATVLAYGQTGTGKTYTMEGFQFSGQHPDRGIVPRSMEEIFKYIENCPNSNTAFMVRASYLQIYNEVISDLLKPEKGNLMIREDKRKGVFVEGLSEWAVRSPSEIYSLMRRGTQVRATASTKLNDISSRSHAVFIIIVEQMNTIEDENGNTQQEEFEEAPKQIKVGKLNLVDLAGSERLSITGATGKRLEECKKINQSLSALGNVISALTEAKPRSHIPYRDSKLTRLLEDSLGGNCKTTMMAMVSPAYSCFSESLSSLKFANRAKNIKNNAKVNEDVDQKALLRKYEAELRSLRKELEEKNKNVMNQEVLYKLEEEKRRAEEDKAAAIIALEARSREFMKEKEEKRKLEEKIKSMSSQMLVGGKKIEDTPQFRNALEEQQRLIRQEYEQKLQDFEKERQQIDEEKVQVDRYKQLLLKQRDIMIALTARLNERDETIIQLQEELDAYDRIHKETEEKLDRKAERIKNLEAYIGQNSLEVPQCEDQDINENENNEMLKARYAPYTEENKESNAPLCLLTAEEKIAELMDVIDKMKQQSISKPSEPEPMPDVEGIQRECEGLKDEKAKLISQIEKNMLGTLDNAIKGLKEQKDQYRLYHINQDIQSLQKMLTSTLYGLK